MGTPGAPAQPTPVVGVAAPSPSPSPAASSSSSSSRLSAGWESELRDHVTRMKQAFSKLMAPHNLVVRIDQTAECACAAMTACRAWSLTRVSVLCCVCCVWHAAGG